MSTFEKPSEKQNPVAKWIQCCTAITIKIQKEDHNSGEYNDK
ncbi:hypothetical protein CCACVL1_04094, partial [Corchorus capsularis]